MNLQSMRDVPNQLKFNYEQSQVNEQVVVFANKIELLDDQRELSNTGDRSCQENSVISLQEEALANLERTIAKDFPQVDMFEISLNYNLNVHESLAQFG